MEVEQPMLRETSSLAPKMSTRTDNNGGSRSSSTYHDNINDLCKRCESFRTLEMGVPMSVSAEKKLSWLRSQIIGGDVEFNTPFGKRMLTYADHTASGRSLHYIEKFIIDNVLPSYGNTHTCDSYVGHRTTNMMHEAISYIKRCLGGGKEDAILFCGSGSTGAIKRLQEVMGITIPSVLRDRFIKCMPKEERWVVFVGPYEHHSNLLSWRQSLAEVVEIDLDENSLLDLEALRQALESYRYTNRPMLGSFSACSNVTGIHTDTRSISKLLHQYGAFACFDFAASGPYVEIDMRSGEIDGYDAVFISPHKFLGGPGTPGILLMSKALYQLGSCPPSTCGGGTVNYVNGFNEKDTLYIEDIEERENGGTPQIIQIIRAALTFWVKSYIGYEVIEELEHKYIKEALKRLMRNPNIEVLGNTTANRLSILSFLIYSTTNFSEASMPKESNGDKKAKFRRLYLWGESGNKRDKPLHGPFVATLLNDLFGIQARGGCACAGPYGHCLLGVTEVQSLALRSAIEKGFSGVKPGWTRVSFPYYMSQEEFEFTVAALEFIATYGQRFLPLYHFNIKTGNWTFKKKAVKGLLGKEKNDQIPISPLVDATKALNIHNSEATGHQNEDVKHNSVVNKYASHLESARNIASHLPKFPPSRPLKEDVDPDLLHFKI